jgi:hypothetical protein
LQEIFLSALPNLKDSKPYDMATVNVWSYAGQTSVKHLHPHLYHGSTTHIALQSSAPHLNSAHSVPSLQETSDGTFSNPKDSKTYELDMVKRWSNYGQTLFKPHLYHGSTTHIALQSSVPHLNSPHSVPSLQETSGGLPSDLYTLQAAAPSVEKHCSAVLLSAGHRKGDG